MKFIETADGSYINLDRISKICKSERDDDLGPIFSFLDADGRLLGRATFHFDPDNLISVMIPAEPGTHAAVIWTHPDLSDRPGEADVTARLVSVLAWRLVDRMVEPVLLEAPQSHEVVAFPLPGGQGWLVPYGEWGTFESVEAARAFYLHQAQHEWDVEHGR
jgi:hypothetical protein